MKDGGEGELEQKEKAEIQVGEAQGDQDTSIQQQRKKTVENPGNKGALWEIIEIEETDNSEDVEVIEEEAGRQQEKDIEGEIKGSKTDEKKEGQTTAVGQMGMTTRTSKRLCRDGTLVSQNAEQLKKKQNLDTEGALWAIWKTRNDLVFNDQIMKSPMVIIHKTTALLTQWKTLLKKGDLEMVESWIKKLKDAC
ncbi:unnamed protein product [Urochloa humidicola]